VNCLLVSVEGGLLALTDVVLVAKPESAAEANRVSSAQLGTRHCWLSLWIAPAVIKSALRMTGDPYGGSVVAPSAENYPNLQALMNEEGKHDGRRTEAG
jgi:hypothetical protein